MKSKILCLLLIVPLLFVIIAFTASRTIQLPVDLIVENLVLEHNEKEAVALTKPYKLYAYTVPAVVQADIVWSVSDEGIAYIEDGYLIGKTEGIVTVFAELAKGSLKRSFTAYVYQEGTNPRYILINNPNLSGSGINDEYYFGEYDYVDGQKVNASLNLSMDVIPYNVSQAMEYEVTTGNAHFENQQLIIDGTDNVEIKVTSKLDESIFATYQLNIVAGGVNIYSYDDLLNATNRSETGDIVVMQRNLESISNAYSNGKLLRNTVLFGLGSRNELVFEYAEFDSTADTTFLNNNKQSTNLKMAIAFKQDVYGNGYTINAHEMCFPTKKENGTLKPINGPDDLFKGPLPFVDVLGFIISGQDNIGFGLVKDGITVDNINLKNCNFVTDLTHLDYVGTVVEVMADDITIKNSLVSNGRTVLRAFSAENLLIDNCLLQYAREFILKIGSNSIYKPEPNQTLPTNRNDLFNFLSPIPRDSENNVLSDSSATIKDTYFYKSGFFSIGLDSQFAGELLYNGKYGGYDLSSNGIYNIAGTSYASKLKLEGDVRFYDWKKISELDSSTLVTVTSPDLDVERFFNVSEMIYQKVSGTAMEIIKDNESYVHGGIAFFGGGRNLSTVEFSPNLADEFATIKAAVDDDDFGSGGKILVHAAGYGEFKFHVYLKDNINNLFGETPTIADLKEHFK